MQHINRNNYEAFFLDYHEGNLSDGLKKELLLFLDNNPDYRISVESHTDNSGNPEQIQSLTDRRSYAIAEKFTTLGVEEGRIVAKGYGASVPVAPNTTNVNRAKNRRIQVILNLFPQP